MVQNTPFSVLADHDGANTSGYRYYRDNVQVQEKPVADLAAGTIAFAEAAGLAAGTYTIKVSAFNVDAETESDVIVLVVTLPPPAQPTNVRIVV